MGGLAITKWLVVLVVVVLIFGTKKLRNIGQDLGSAIRGFKEGMKGEDDKAAVEDDQAAVKRLNGEAEQKDKEA